MSVFSDLLPWLFGTILFVVDMVIRVIALFVVPRNRRPSSANAWLLLIFLLPTGGIILFWIIGRSKLPLARRKKYKTVVGQIEAISRRFAESKLPLAQPRSPGLQHAVQLAEALGAQPMFGGNKAQILTDSQETLLQIAESIRAAKSYVHMEFYILVLDRSTQPVFDAMKEAVQRGVTVRVLLDHWGALSYSGTLRTRRALDEAGVSWAYMLPLQLIPGRFQRPDLRNHRKIVVVDNEIAYMGSQNLIDETYNSRTALRKNQRWRDLMVRIEGPAVTGLDAVFRGDWFSETDELLPDATELELRVVPQPSLECQVLPSGPAFATENNLQVFVALFYAATERISITSPYFIPDGGLMHALRSARARGVNVELFVSEIAEQPLVYHAQRSYYEELLKMGVNIYLYPSPCLLHSKHFTIDRDLVVIGSSNMDQRSFNLNMEVSLLVHCSEFTSQIDKILDEQREISKLLTLQQWKQQPLRSQLLDNLARLTSALQ